MRNPKTDGSASRNEIGPRVRKARVAFDPPLTQDQLAGRLAAIGIALDRVAITKIECGQRCVFDFEIAPLAAVLRVDVRWLLGMQNSGGPTKTGRRAE